MGKPGYEYLITYQYSIEIYDLTVDFVDRFLPGREHVRTREQMIQAARSCKQNIVEGYMEKSTKAYIKLLGVARASLEELLEDFRDFSRGHRILLRDKWDKRDKRENTGKYVLPLSPLHPLDPFIPVNYMVNLIRRTTYLLDRQMTALERKFVTEGGYTEKLFQKRIAYRRGS
jgi:restriction system protein